MKPRSKHNALQKAWLDGEDIQVEVFEGKWRDDAIPEWSDFSNYRIKPAEPERIYPMTSMLYEDLRTTYNLEGNGLFSVANAAIRRAIDDGQVVIASDRGERDTKIAEAVRKYICVLGTPSNLVLKEIIAGVK